VAIESRSAHASVVRFYRLVQERLLTVSEDLSAERFSWSGGLSLHSVAWQLWHSARWDDFFAAHVQADFGRDPQTELWQREGLARKWSFSPGSIGRRDAGTGMDDASAERMRFPEQSAVIDYSRGAFDFAISTISALSDDQMTMVAKDDPDGDTYLDNILIYYEHLNRHLGMIEAIRGLQGLSGSATR
jgi:DinB family protein